MPSAIKLRRVVQPYMECGPAALKMVMEYLTGKHYNLNQIIKETKSEEKYVDWDFKLGIAAIRRGFRVTIFTMSTDFFDPSWYKLSKSALIRKLKKRLKFILHYNKRNIRDGYIWWWYESSHKAIISFLEHGGKIVFKPISKELIISYLSKRIPVICSVNGSIFYSKRRVYRGKYDDIRGEYFGHIVVVTGYKNGKFIITDTEKISNKTGGIIEIDADLLINCILTSTGNLIVLES